MEYVARFYFYPIFITVNSDGVCANLSMTIGVSGLEGAPILHNEAKAWIGIAEKTHVQEKSLRVKNNFPGKPKNSLKSWMRTTGN